MFTGWQYFQRSGWDNKRFSLEKNSDPASYTINNIEISKTIVKNLGKGVYRFELKVTDDGNLSVIDTILIIVTDLGHPNRPPVVNAGADQTITLPINSIIIDGIDLTSIISGVEQ